MAAAAVQHPRYNLDDPLHQRSSHLHQVSPHRIPTERPQRLQHPRYNLDDPLHQRSPHRTPMRWPQRFNTLGAFSIAALYYSRAQQLFAPASQYLLTNLSPGSAADSTILYPVTPRTAANRRVFPNMLEYHPSNSTPLLLGSHLAFTRCEVHESSSQK